MTRYEQHGGAKSSVIMGALLMLVGTVLLLERLDVLPTDLVRHFWPLFWMVFGGVLLASNRSPFGKAFGLFLIMLGCGLELEKLGYIKFRIRDLWPIQLIAIGGFMLWRALSPGSFNSSRRTAGAARISEFAMFGGTELKVTSSAFEGGDLTAIFGGHDIDLREAQMAGPSAEIQADAFCGGVSLKVPQTWRVTVDGPAIFGGIESKTLTPPDSTNAPHLIVRSFAMFGGVEVKN